MQIVYNERLATQMRVSRFDMVRPGSTKNTTQTMQNRTDQGRAGNPLPAVSFGSNPVKPGQTDCPWSNWRPILCKAFKMNNLEIDQPSGGSNPVKLNQTGFLCLVAVLFLGIAHFWQNVPNRPSK
jgi:hypothetical protein